MATWQRYEFRYGGNRYLVCERLHASKLVPAGAVHIDSKSAGLIAKSALRGPGTGKSQQPNIPLEQLVRELSSSVGRFVMVRLARAKATGSPGSPASVVSHAVEPAAPNEIADGPVSKICEVTPIETLIEFTYARMIENVNSSQVAYMRENLEVTWTEALIPLQVYIDLVQAYYRWYELVKSGAEWDYKALIKQDYGNWACDYANTTHYLFDVWSNIHYGYVGLAAGFSEGDLLDGAGIAQLMAGTVPDGYWRRRLEKIGDADVFRALDDPRDQAAVRVGFELWKAHGDALEPDQLLAAVRAHVAELSTEPCKAGAPGDPVAVKPPVVLDGSVGANADNRPADVQRVRARLVALGFDWLGSSSTCDDQLIAAIKLFQSITSGHQTLKGDGRVDVGKRTHAWLNAKNAPRWQLLTASGTGYENYERADTSDDHDYGTSWLNDFIGAAGKHYQTNHRASHTGAALMSINDASKPHGGDTKDHKGHETGLDIDVRLPRTDGTSGGITVSSSLYDRDAMRAMLQAFKAQTGCDRVYLSDSTLVAEGLCKALGGHDNHAHVGIAAPSRQD